MKSMVQAGSALGLGILIGIGATLSFADAERKPQPIPSPYEEPESLPAGTACAKPVIMMVQGRIEDPQALANYANALRQSPIYPEQQGYYMLRRPVEMFEGTWEADRFILAARFPCIEAARGFWWSKAYREIVPLRKTMGAVTVSVHEMADAPPYITGGMPKRLLAKPAFTPADPVPPAALPPPRPAAGGTK